MPFGILSHLRCFELFKKIGDFYGGFLDIFYGEWSDAFVLIKVLRKTHIPDKVPVLFGTTMSVVRIVASPDSVTSSASLNKCSLFSGYANSHSLESGRPSSDRVAHSRRNLFPQPRRWEPQ
ncbi:unnamed protein product [Linum trigynum]|uniref:Uncharacterized protein n=1 Tax=Linum trigynum TaxID=586398 RepID=A0AAV2FXV1_9ROSI